MHIHKHHVSFSAEDIVDDFAASWITNNSLFKHSKIHQEYKKILSKPNYPKQYANLSTANLRPIFNECCVHSALKIRNLDEPIV